MEIVKIILIVLEVLASVALCAVIMMQSSKENGLGTIAGNSDTFMNKGGRMGLDKMLASATKWIALGWVVLTLLLCLL